MQTFNTGDVVTCRGPRGYDFTLGKDYTVVGYEEAGSDGVSPFVWPAYVEVIDDAGRKVHCHAHRFALKQ
jgi:hypothetical protein